MRIDRTCIGNTPFEAECVSVNRAIETFRSRLSDIELPSNGSGPSQTIKKALEEISETPGWEKKYLFSREAHTSLPNANYTVNYLFVTQNCDCGFRHKVFFHLCFDNRQAIGTNLLRFKLATFTNAKGPMDRPFAVAVVADASAKAKYGWDNSAGTYEEFVQAIELEYAEVLDLTLNFLIIRP